LFAGDCGKGWVIVKSGDFDNPGTSPHRTWLGFRLAPVGLVGWLAWLVRNIGENTNKGQGNIYLAVKRICLPEIVVRGG